MRLTTMATLAASLLPGAAAAQSMNAEAFYARASALKAKGPLALLSGDLRPLMREGRASGEAARQERLAAAKAGRPTRYCPPGDVHGMDRQEYFHRLEAIPRAERRRIDMLEATNRILAGKYPCPR